MSHITLTYWPNVSGLSKSEMVLPWAEVPDLIRQAGNLREKDSSPLVKFATFGDIRAKPKTPGQLGCLRNDLNVINITGLEGDYDAGEVSPAEAIARLQQHNLRAIVATTYTHRPDKPRWRVYTPLRRPVAPEERLRYAEVLNGALGGILAPESKDLSRSYFIGWPPGIEPEVLTTFDDAGNGYFLDDIDHADEIRKPFVGKTKPATEGKGGQAGDNLAELLAGEDVHGNALRLIGQLARKGVEKEFIRIIFAELAKGVAKVRGPERAQCLMGTEFDRMLDGAFDKYGPPAPVDFSAILAPTKGTPTGTAPADKPDWLIPVGELLEQPPPLSWLIKGYLLPETLTMMFGPQAAGKSLLAIWWAVCVGLGRPWLDHRVRQGPVVYVAGEGHFGIRRRLLAWAIEHDCREELAAAPIFVSRSGTRIIDPKSFQAVVEDIDGVAELYGPPVLIVVDTLHRNLGGEENSETDIGNYVRACDALRPRYRCTAWTAPHTGLSDQTRGRGSSALGGDHDIIFGMAVDANKVSTMTAMKTKDMPTPPPLSFAIKPIELPWHDEDGDAETSIVLEPMDAPNAHHRTASPSARLGMDALLATLDKLGEPLPAHLAPPGPRPPEVVHLDDWRAEFYSRHTGDSTDAKKKAFQRARMDLVKNRAAGHWQDHYWPNLEGDCQWSDIANRLLTRAILLKPDHEAA